jgi:hypothetical protein
MSKLFIFLEPGQGCMSITMRFYPRYQEYRERDILGENVVPWNICTLEHLYLETLALLLHAEPPGGCSDYYVILHLVGDLKFVYDRFLIYTVDTARV